MAELDGMFSRRTSDGNYAILPIWHNVTREEVAAFSPMLAGKVALNSSDGAFKLASRIREVVTKLETPGDPAAYGNHFARRTLRVVDLPLAYGTIDDCYFQSCHFLGPAVLALQDQNHTNHVSVASPEAFFPLRIGRGYVGLIAVRRSAFIDCVFEGVGFGIPDDQYDEFMRTSGDGSRFIAD